MHGGPCETTAAIIGPGAGTVAPRAPRARVPKHVPNRPNPAATFHLKASPAVDNAVSERTWLGIDFSGDHRMWTKGRATSNVWVATVHDLGRALVVHDLRRVQDLPGADEPFDRLATLLRSGAYSAAGIDAPFSVPEHRCPAGSHQVLLTQAAQWERVRRPFAPAATLLRHLLPSVGPPGVKEYRTTECGWGLSVRSTTWAGARGGTAMTVACLTLLARIGRPIWPFAENTLPGIIVEAFPAAQLKTWGLPFYGYNGAQPSAQEQRQRIVLGLRERLQMNGHDRLLLQSADALDAVVCAFAGIAVKAQALARRPENLHSAEGSIAVHR